MCLRNVQVVNLAELAQPIPTFPFRLQEAGETDEPIAITKIPPGDRPRCSRSRCVFRRRPSSCCAADDRSED